MISFVSNIVNKRQKYYKIVKLTILSISIVLFLSLTAKVISLAILNSAIDKTKASFLQNSKNSIDYEKKINILSPSIKLKDVKIHVSNGNVDINNATLKVKRGFIFPSTVAIKIEGISTQAIGGKKYSLKPKQGNIHLDVFINNHIFKKSSFGGLQISNPVYMTINNDDGGNNGHIKIDACKVIKNDGLDYFLMEQKGSLLLNNMDLIPSLIMVDRPFSWDIKLAEKTNYTDSRGLNKEEPIYHLDIRKMTIDYGFSKINIAGSSTRNNKLQSADMTVIIDNDEKLLDSMFNLATQTRSNSNEVLEVKKMYLKLKNTIIPLLKQNSNNTNKKQLVLTIKKQQDKELSVNSLLASEIAGKIIGK